MTHLRQILLGRDWVAKDALRSALHHQKEMGGSLAVCLLEVGAISEERLLRALSEKYGVPYAEVGALRETPPEVAALLPEKLARRTRAVPFHHAGTALHVAMLDPTDLAAQDEIAFACGKRLHIHVSHPARIAEALDRFYGEEPPSRIAALIDKLNRSRFLWRDEGDEGAAGGAGTDATKPSQRQPEDDGWWDRGAPLDPPELPDPVAELFPEEPSGGTSRPSHEGSPESGESGPRAERTGRAAAPGRTTRTPQPPPRSIQLSPEERRKLYGDRTAPAAGETRPTGPMPSEPFAAAAQRLETARDRDEVGAILLDLMASQFLRSLLFVVRGDRIEGWRGRGEKVDAAVLRNLSIPADQPSVFLNLSRGTPFHLGPLADFPTHRELAKVWRGEPPSGCLVVPVRLHDRLVLALYGDRGDEPIRGVPLHRFQDLASRTATALERCIVLKKKRTSGAEQS